MFIVEDSNRIWRFWFLRCSRIVVVQKRRPELGRPRKELNGFFIVDMEYGNVVQGKYLSLLL